MGLRCVIASLLATAACQPLYGGQAEIQHRPEKKPEPSVVTAVQPITYVEDCTVNFEYSPASAAWHPHPARARQLVTDGDGAQQAAARGSEEKRVMRTLDALWKYRLALEADPYDAEATLKLALEYDALLRKGCALAMLHRLTALTINPKFITAANAQIQTVGDNPSWFKGYRNEALVAVGLPPQRSRTTP
jgi:hypothetical protein